MDQDSKAYRLHKVSHWAIHRFNQVCRLASQSFINRRAKKFSLVEGDSLALLVLAGMCGGIVGSNGMKRNPEV